jgi:hypothetical protein
MPLGPRPGGLWFHDLYAALAVAAAVALFKRESVLFRT